MPTCRSNWNRFARPTTWSATRTCEVVFGARDLAQSTHRAKRKLSRTLATWLFREVVKRLVSHEVTDTQCGLKAFSLRAAREIFSRLTLDGFSFDAEVVFLTQRLGLKFQRIPVNLVREYGSTLSLRRHTIPMLRDIVGLWWRNRHLQELPLPLPRPASGYPEPAAAPTATRQPDNDACRVENRNHGRAGICRSPRGRRTIAARADRSARRIALHADDLGMNPAVTDGILQGFEQGLLTSTSLLSNAPDAARALDRWRQLESRRAQGSLASMARRERLQDPAQPFDLGIHLNLTQGRPLTGPRYPAELLDASGRFPGIFGLFRRLRGSDAAGIVAAAIEEELTCQVQFMLDRGHRPTHLNGHQYIEMLPVVGGVVESLLEKFRIPVVRVAWEPSWRQSFTWPGISTSQWLIGGLKKVYAGRFRRQMLGKQGFLCRRVLRHDDRRHDVVGDDSRVSGGRARFPACGNRLASRRQAGRNDGSRRRLARPAGRLAAARTGDGCLRRIGRTACGQRLPLGQAWPRQT